MELSYPITTWCLFRVMVVNPGWQYPAVGCMHSLPSVVIRTGQALKASLKFMPLQLYRVSPLIRGCSEADIDTDMVSFVERFCPLFGGYTVELLFEML